MVTILSNSISTLLELERLQDTPHTSPRQATLLSKSSSNGIFPLLINRDICIHLLPIRSCIPRRKESNNNNKGRPIPTSINNLLISRGLEGSPKPLHLLLPLSLLQRMSCSINVVLLHQDSGWAEMCTMETRNMFRYCQTRDPRWVTMGLCQLAALLK